MLSMPTLRVMWEAKNQLKQLLVSAGFPEECLQPVSMDFNGPDASLDTLAGLLAAGTYPNVCYHKEKRKVRARKLHVLSISSPVTVRMTSRC